MQHVDRGEQAPGDDEALTALSARSEENAVAAGLDRTLVELVRIRASQLHGCAFCLRLHVRDAIALGETSDRLAVVAAWWESQCSTAEEQAALLIAERVTAIGDQHPVRRPEVDVNVLSERQHAAVARVAVVIDAWNRVAITSRYPVAP